MEKKRKQSIETASILDLSSDTLLLILAQLDGKDLQSVSLVSKHFLSLTNQLVRKLTFLKLPRRNSTFQKLFTRFSSANQIDLYCPRALRVLDAIFISQFNIEYLQIRGCRGQRCPSEKEQHRMLHLCSSFKKLKALSLGCCFCRVGSQVFDQLDHPFPCLEKLNLSDCARSMVGDEWIARFIHQEELHLNDCVHWSSSDDRIRKLTSKVPNLRKIDLCFHKDRLTDLALDALSANCVNLEEVSFQGFSQFTPRGLFTFLRQLRNLRSIGLPCFWPRGLREAEFLPLVEAISAFDNLSHLSLKKDMVQDNILCAIAKSSHAPLTSLSMENSGLYLHEYTMTGVSAMLCAFQRLTRLSIELPISRFGSSDQDMIMSQLVKSLVCLKDIVVTSHCTIYVTLFSLIDNCPLLEFIWLHAFEDAPANHSGVCVPQQIRKNNSIKRISLRPAPETLLKMGLESVCPSVKIECLSP